MSVENVITLIAAVLALIASLVAAVVSLYNARFRRFTREHWWERRADAYTKVMQALSDLVEYHRRVYDSHLESKELSDETMKELEKRWKRGYRQTMEAANIGAFLFSSEAEAALKAFQRGPERHGEPGDWFSEVEEDYMAAERCLQELVKCSKKDLSVG